MLRSLWSGVTGLTTHQTKMDVIGNNIANVNTTSYKSQAAGFQDILYQTRKEAYAATDTNGAVNAAQVGLGTRMSSIFTNITQQGSAVVTDNPLDLMINGDAFFLIESEGDITYTRDGSFSVDEEGYLVTRSNGKYVRGQMGSGDITGDFETQRLLVVNRKNVVEEDEYGNRITKFVDMIPGAASTAAHIKGIVDSKDDAFDDEGLEVGLDVYGTDGKHYNLKYILSNAGDTDDSTFDLALKSVTDEKGNAIETSTETLKLAFDKSNGDLKTVTQGNNVFEYERNDKDKLVIKGNKKLNVSFTDNAKIGPFNLDVSYMSNYRSKLKKPISTVTASKGDMNGNDTGYPSGELNGISVRLDGSIYGSYSNGQAVKKGQIALAEFSNAMGLEKAGENLYKVTANSGNAQILDSTKGRVNISSGVLEGSNVDLASEFTDMITTQRGFQANSKVITTSDEMLQVLRDLKR